MKVHARAMMQARRRALVTGTGMNWRDGHDWGESVARMRFMFRVTVRVKVRVSVRVRVRVRVRDRVRVPCRLMVRDRVRMHVSQAAGTRLGEDAG